MRDWSNKIVRGNVWDDFRKTFHFADRPVSILVATYNRLPLLQKCIWSIIASTTVPYSIVVGNDNSDDGTEEWLDEMQDRELLVHVNFPVNSGSVDNYNWLVGHAKDEWCVMIQDDIYIHRWWDIACMDLILKRQDAGYVSFYNYSRKFDTKKFVKIDNEIIYSYITGLSATWMKKELWETVGHFKLPSSHTKMGFYDSLFCGEAVKLKSLEHKRKAGYFTIPDYAEIMDRKNHRLGEEEYQINSGYIAHRAKFKKSVGGVGNG